MISVVCTLCPDIAPFHSPCFVFFLSYKLYFNYYKPISPAFIIISSYSFVLVTIMFDSLAPTKCLTIQFNSDTNHLELEQTLQVSRTALPSSISLKDLGHKLPALWLELAANLGVPTSPLQVWDLLHRLVELRRIYT